MRGIAGRLHAPVASTTARAQRTSSLVRISKPSWSRAHGLDSRAGAHRRGDETGVPSQGGDDVGEGHEAVGVVAGVVVAWKACQPVRGE